jgi:hypothetical protein
LFFLLKCLACIAIVILALHWRAADGTASAPESHSRAPAAKSAVPHHPPIEGSAKELIRAGANAAMSAARDKCLSAPRDCAAALQRLQGGARDR